MVAISGFKPELIFRAVEEMYTAVAREPAREFHFPTGRTACLAVGYPEEALRDIPSAALESFAGVAYPHAANAVQPGDTVLDIGAGSGTDTLIASRRVGAAGKVFALDMTPAMRDKLAATLRQHDIANVEILAGNAEAIPLPDASVDVVTTNGVLNLVPNKARAFAEIFRVLKPGGRVQIADIALAKPIADKYRRDPTMWAECVVGAVAEEQYLQMLRAAGLHQVERLLALDYFALSRSSDTRAVATLFGARAMVASARKPPGAHARVAQRERWRRLASESAAVAGAGIAFGVCSGFPALLSALTAVGAGALAQHAYMFPLFVGCLGAGLWLLRNTAQANGHLTPFWIAAASSAVAIVTFWLSVTGLAPAAWWGPYVGLAGMAVASFWSFFDARAPRDCLAEMTREAAKPETSPRRKLVRNVTLILAAAVATYGMYKSVAVFTS